MINLITFSTLYPNREQPHHGIFVERRLLHLLETGGVHSSVVAPVPWFPLRSQAFGSYAVMARVPRVERRNGVDLVHPRYLRIPKLGMTIAPWTMARGVQSTFRRLLDHDPRVDLIDAHYFYPDGVAAAIVARRLGKPLVITARGTDVNLIPRYRRPRSQILWAARYASAVITVCEALKRALVDLGVDEGKITVLRNGVDLQRFHPVDAESARRRLGLRRAFLLSVGHLIPRKGHEIVIRALAALPEVDLVIVGGGPRRSDLERLARKLGVAQRVRFVGPVPPEELKYFYSAADALVLASSREGMANVLLESLACGTPVIATATWGTPEVIDRPAAGVLMERRDPENLVAAFRALMSNYPDRAATRRYAESLGWESTSAGQRELFSQVLSREGPAARSR